MKSVSELILKYVKKNILNKLWRKQSSSEPNTFSPKRYPKFRSKRFKVKFNGFEAKEKRFSFQEIELTKWSVICISKPAKIREIVLIISNNSPASQLEV